MTQKSIKESTNSLTFWFVNSFLFKTTVWKRWLAIHAIRSHFLLNSSADNWWSVIAAKVRARGCCLFGECSKDGVRRNKSLCWYELCRSLDWDCCAFVRWKKDRFRVTRCAQKCGIWLGNDCLSYYASTCLSSSSSDSPTKAIWLFRISSVNFSTEAQRFPLKLTVCISFIWLKSAENFNCPKIFYDCLHF